MFIDKNSIIINNVNLGQYLLQVEYGYNKLWAGDTGRNLKGKTTGTFLGIIVKLKLTFGRLSRAEMELISPILNSAWQTTQYYDPDKKQMLSIETYMGDWTTLNKSTFTNVAKANASFDVSVIATTPRR